MQKLGLNGTPKLMAFANKNGFWLAKTPSKN
jgi:hypothetical protein